MTTLILFAAAAAAETASGWIDGSTLATIIASLAAGGGYLGGRYLGGRGKDAPEVRVAQPLQQEQSPSQASWKDNARDHENLFGRMACVEQRLSALDAKVDAKFEAIKEQLSETKDMVRQLFDRICGRKSK